MFHRVHAGFLGTPLGQSEYVVAQLQEMIESHRTLLE